MPSDHTPIERKAENALVAYLQSILASLSLTDLQVVPSYQDASALESPRAVVSAVGFTPRGISLPGVFDGQITVSYISQTENETEATHQTTAGTLLSWLLDLPTVKAALSATADFHCFLYQFAGAPYEADAEEGTHTTTMTFNVIVQGMDV